MIFQELEGTPKSCITVPSDYESDGEEAFPELEIPVSILNALTLFSACTTYFVTS